MNVDIDVAVEVFGQPEVLRARADVGQCSLCRLLHHIAKLSGSRQLALAVQYLHLGLQNRSADLGPCESGDQSDLALLMGLLVYYGNISRPFYVVLTAIVMTGSVMVSYTRARAENTIPSCKVGFMERPERLVLLILGGAFTRMAPVLWVIATISTLTVVHRVVYTWQELRAGRTLPEASAF